MSPRYAPLCVLIVSLGWLPLLQGFRPAQLEDAVRNCASAPETLTIASNWTPPSDVGVPGRREAGGTR